MKRPLVHAAVLILALGLVLAGPQSATAPPAKAEAAASPSPPQPGLRLLRSDETGVELELYTPDFQVETAASGTTCRRLTVAGYAATDEAGRPQLPVRGAMVGVPPDAALRLTVLKSESLTLPGRYDPCPVPHPGVEQTPAGDFRYRGRTLERDTGAYATDTPYPASVAEVVSTGFIRSQRVARLRLHPFQVDPASGELRHHRRIRVRLDFVRPAVRLQAAAATARQEQISFESQLRSILLNYDDARRWRRPRPAQTTAPAVHAQGQSHHKILVNEDGLYRVTRPDLQAAGVEVDELDPRTLRLENRGQEVAIHVVGEGDGSFDTGDYVLFYGQKMDTRYTETNVYWLGWGDGNGRRMADRDGQPGGSGVVPTAFSTTFRWEENHNYQSSIPSGEGGDHWFAGYVYATAPTSETYTFELHNLATAPYSATIRGRLYGYSHFGPTPDHHTRVYLNGHLVDDVTWDGWREYQFEHDIPSSYLAEGLNEITVECPFDLGPDVISDIVFVNWFEIDYRDTHVAESDVLLFNHMDTGTWEYQIGGFTTDTLELLDVTSPTAPIRVLSPTVELISSTFTLRLDDTITSGHRYLALATGQRLDPLSIDEDEPSDLHSPANGADYLIVTHGDFVTDVLPLADHRDSLGLRTAVVDVQDIYDEFNHGILDPAAIHDFLEYAYENWAPPAPTYVLLVGDGNYDFLNHLERDEPNYVPPYLAYVDPWIGEVAADNRYVCVSGEDILPDMHLGRLPVKTAAEAAAMVAKLLAYEQNPPDGDWNQRTLFVADNADDAGDFDVLSDEIADQFLPPPYRAEKIYYQVTHSSASQARADILSAINDGRLLVNYIGHATIQFWAFEHLFDVSDIATLTNTERLPLMVPMTCLDGYYIHPSPSGSDFSSLGESIVRAPGGGAIASWSPTGLGVSTGHDFLNKGLYEALFFDDITRLGPATTQAKLYLYANSGGFRDLLDTYLLLGDPALRLNVLRANVAISKTVSPPSAVRPSDAITYTLTYSNAGPATAHHVVITDLLAAQLVSPTATSGGVTLTLRPGSRYVWDVADLPAGEGGAITITATISPTFGGVLSNTARIATTAIQSDTLNDASAVDITVTPYAAYLPLVFKFEQTG